jgi:hypothetical protein
MKNVKRAYFTYPVADGLLEAATIFAAGARHAGLELVVNNSQFQGTPDDPAFRDLQRAPSFRNLQHRLANRIFDWAQIGQFIFRPLRITKTCALLSRKAWPSKIPFSCHGVRAKPSFRSPVQNTYPVLPRELVGASGFEPPTSWSRQVKMTRINNLAGL